MGYTPPHDTPFVNGTGPGPSNLVDADYLNRVDANQADADARLQVLETASGSLSDIGALTPADNDLLQRKSGHWANRTPAQVMTDLAAQPLDSDLTAIAALTPTDNDVVQRKSGAWVNRTPAQLLTDLAAQPLDSDLTAIAALAPPDNDLLQRKSGAWINRTPAQVKTDLAVKTADLADFPVFVVAAPTGTAATDTAAIQAALDAANTAGRGVVQLQKGTYKIAAPGTASAGGVRAYSNTVLAGCGIGVTTLQVAAGTSTDITGIIRTPTGVVTTSVLFRDFTVDGNKAAVTGTPSIIGFYAGVTPQSTSTDLDIAVERVEIMNCSDYGFDPHERVTRLRLTDCLSHDNTNDGFTLDGCYDWLVEGCTAWNNGRHGFNFVTASARGRVVGCYAYSNGSNGFTAQQGAKHISFAACRAYNNTAVGYVLNGVAQTTPQLDLVAGGNHTLSGCTALANGTHGYQLVGISGCTLIGCQAIDSSQATTNTSDHFRIAESGTVYSTNNTLLGCTWSQSSGVSNAAKYGIEEQSSNDGPNFVLGCSGSGTATGSLLLLHATSLLVAAHNGTAGGHPATFAYASDSPAKHGFLEWNFDLACLSSTSAALTYGVLSLAKITPQASGTINNITLHLGTAATGALTSGQNFVALFDSSGNRLAVSADQTSSWGTTGVKTVALTSSASVTAGADYYVAILVNGASTPPCFSRGSTSVQAANAGLGTTALRFASNGATQTAVPSSYTPSSNTGSSVTAYWCALS